MLAVRLFAEGATLATIRFVAPLENTIPLAFY
jgi:hypothetical protein